MSESRVTAGPNSVTLAGRAELVGGPAAQLDDALGAGGLPLAAGDGERDRLAHAVVGFVGHDPQHRSGRRAAARAR